MPGSSMKRRPKSHRLLRAVASVLLLAALAAPAHAQYSLTWASHYNGPGNGADLAQAMATDVGGNVIIAGTTMMPDSLNRLTVVKFNSGGVQQWQYHYVGPGIGDYPVRLGTDGGSNVYVAGMSFEPDSSTRALLIKLDPSGVPQWVRRDGPSGFSEASTDLAVNGAGTCYVTGHRNNAPAAWVDSLLHDFAFVTRRISSSGALMWTATAAEFQGPVRVQIGPGGDPIVVGTALGDTAGTVITRDLVVIRYASATGATVWRRAVDSGDSGDDEAVAFMGDGLGNNTIVTGTSTPPGDSLPSRILTACVSSAGTVCWTSLHAEAFRYLRASSIGTSAGLAFVVGQVCDSAASCGAVLIRFEPGGSEGGSITFSGPGGGSNVALPAVRIGPDGTVHLVGLGSLSCGSVDIFSLGYRQNLSLNASTLYDRTAGWDEGVDVIPVGGNVYVACTTWNPASNFDLTVLKYAFTITSVGPGELDGGTVSLGPSHPNPFELRSRFDLTVGSPSWITVEIFDHAGRLIARPVENRLYPAGVHQVLLESARMRSGVYFCRLTSVDAATRREQVQIRRAVLVR